MNGEAPLKEEPGDLVTDYREAVRARGAARGVIAGAMIIIVGVYVTIMAQSVLRLPKEGAPEFTATLTTEAAALAPMVQSRLEGMTERLLPVYSDVMARSFIENQDAYLELLSDEFVKLEAYANSRMPEMEERLGLLVLEQEEAAREALSGILTPQQATDLSEAYRVALMAYFEERFSEMFAVHAETAENVFMRLEELAQANEGMVSRDSQEVIGMAVELLGLEIQDPSGVTLFLDNE